MGYLIGFLPWIAFSVVSGFAWQWAALLALAVSVLLRVRDRRAGVTADAQILDFSTIAFFGLLAAVAFVDPRSPLQAYENGLSSAWLALIGMVSLLAGQPFTLGIAKRRAAPEIWHTAVFRRTNTVLTSAWTISFALSAVTMLALEAASASQLPQIVAQLLGFGIPVAFTRCYVRTVRARAAAVASPFPAVGRFPDGGR